MSKFCGNCGASLDDSAIICGYCGAPLNDGTPDQNQNQAQEQKSKINTAGVAAIFNELKGNKIVKIAIPAVLGLIVVIVAISIISGFTGHKGAVRSFVNAYEKMETDTLISMSSELATKGEDETTVEMLEQRLDGHFEHVEEKLDSEPKISYKVLKNESLKDSKLNKYKDMFEELDLDESIVKKGRTVKLRITYKYDEKRTKTHTTELVMFKENGDWKFYNPDQYVKIGDTYNYNTVAIATNIFDK